MGREYKNAVEALAADIAGDGYVTSTSLLNGWTGTAYYEKLSNSLTLVHLAITGIGTTANGTALFTLPAGFRPLSIRAVAIHSISGTDGVGGFLQIDSTGSIKIYDFNAAVTSFTTGTAVYMARN